MLAGAACARRADTAEARHSESPAAIDDTDSREDGTPDFLRLGPADREAFREWFTFLAEAQYFQRKLPPEIDDCAALIRYSYREALAKHDSAWAQRVQLPILPALASVSAYSYPHTPLKAALFRTRPGPFHLSDISDGAFAEFADAETLEHFNTRFLSRSIEQARPGDLLFFRQSGGFHSMVWIGLSHFTNGRDVYVVYHTGPIGGHAGEIRRLTRSRTAPPSAAALAAG